MRAAAPPILQLGPVLKDHITRRVPLAPTFTEPAEVATIAIDAIRADSFWARPSLDDKAHRETVEWEATIYRARAEALIARSDPDVYLWGPASQLLGP